MPGLLENRSADLKRKVRVEALIAELLCVSMLWMNAPLFQCRFGRKFDNCNLLARAGADGP